VRKERKGRETNFSSPLFSPPQQLPRSPAFKNSITGTKAMAEEKTEEGEEEARSQTHTLPSFSLSPFLAQK
jgi:hypothetical protein